MTIDNLPPRYRPIQFVGVITDALRKRFWSKVVKGKDDECWLWTKGTSPRGYGMFKIWGRTRIAPRVVWLLTHGSWPTQFVLHNCDNPRCVNIAHLREGTPLENSTDAVERGQMLRGSRLTQSKLIESDVVQILEMLSQGIADAAVARTFNVTRQCIGNIKHRRTWVHVV